MKATVTFYTGSVSIALDSTPLDVELGAEVPVGATVKTGKDSQCDLQFGSLGTLRVQPETTVTLKEIAVGAERRVSSTKLVVGSVAAKVSKLTSRDRFNVSTKDTVCGVRGTEFIVRAGATGQTKVSVKEGFVALLPPAFDPAPIEAKALGTTVAPAVDAVFVAMLDAAPKVGPAQEASVGSSDLSKASTAWDSIAAALDSAASSAPAALPAPSPSAGAPAVSAPAASAPAAPATPAAASSSLLESSEIQKSLASFGSAPVAAKTKAATAATAKELSTFASMTVYQVPSAAEAPTVSTSSAGNQAAPSQSSASQPAATQQAAPILVPVTVSCTPNDAEILIDGLRVGSGSASVLRPKGSTLEVLVRHAGYEDARLTIKADSASGEKRDVVLKSITSAPASPVALKATETPALVARIATGAGRPVGASIATDDAALFLDASGKLYRVSTKALLWKAATGNSLAETSAPVVSGGFVYVMGDANLSIASLSSGSIVATIPLDKSDSGLFGRRPAVIGKEAFLSSSDGLRVLDSASGKQVRTIPLSEGSDMTPGVSEGSLVFADQTGRFLKIEPSGGKQLFATQTKAIQPVALATTVAAGKAYFADRKGLVTALDLGSGAVLWSKKADGCGAIFDDLVVSGAAVWCYSKGSVFVLSALSGESLMPAISGAATPPFVSQGYVWTPMKGGRLVAHDLSSGAIVKSLAVDGEFAARPVELQGLFMCPLASGDVAVLNPVAAK
jgi:outer membrane protein assembly factor BamB